MVNSKLRLEHISEEILKSCFFSQALTERSGLRLPSIIKQLKILWSSPYKFWRFVYFVSMVTYELLFFHAFFVFNIHPILTMDHFPQCF